VGPVPRGLSWIFGSNHFVCGRGADPAGKVGGQWAGGPCLGVPQGLERASGTETSFLQTTYARPLLLRGGRTGFGRALGGPEFTSSKNPRCGLSGLPLGLDSFWGAGSPISLKPGRPRDLHLRRPHQI